MRRKEIKGRFGIIKFIRLLLEIRRKKFDTVFILSQSGIALLSSALPQSLR